MPRGKTDYQKGLIYTIKTGDSVYVGSTTNYTKRKCRHKSNLKNENQYKIYQTIISNNSEWEMKPYKIFPCNSKLELEIEEEKIRRELNADLNMKRVCFVSEEEKKIETKKTNNKSYEKNKEKTHKRHKKWREENKEAITEMKKKKIFCECGCSVSNSNIHRHKKSKKHTDFILSNNTE
jgi:hypothetical protein|tara:strand:- start:423 stop:959 length:537 start_codon:yes stop_codon:yes gene_type:complete